MSRGAFAHLLFFFLRFYFSLNRLCKMRAVKSGASYTNTLKKTLDISPNLCYHIKALR